jgi:PPK2 family polyphosphate:nucleotide phosphotransferase
VTSRHNPEDVLHGLRVEPGERARLGQRDPAGRCGLQNKEDGAERVARDLDALLDLQRRLWAESRRSVLLVLQGMDASGKDGTIRRVFAGVNPQGCRVVSFKAPTPVEAAHDFLWRIHQVVPAHGEIGIFNRSHYEDVVAARVLGIIDEAKRKRRCNDITTFEHTLSSESTVLVKVFLHISRDEQRKRLQARLDDPTKRWKFNPDDLAARAHWDDYQKLYDDALTKTSTKVAPWYVVPADHKWVRDVVVARLLVSTLEQLDPQYPKPPADLDQVRIT